jgi:hypothetical protein
MQLFSCCGTVKSCTMSGQGEHRVCVVDFENSASAHAATCLSNTLLGDTKIKVTQVEIPKPPAVAPPPNFPPTGAVMNNALLGGNGLMNNLLNNPVSAGSSGNPAMLNLLATNPSLLNVANPLVAGSPLMMQALLLNNAQVQMQQQQQLLTQASNLALATETAPITPIVPLALPNSSIISNLGLASRPLLEARFGVSVFGVSVFRSCMSVFGVSLFLCVGICP